VQETHRKGHEIAVHSITWVSYYKAFTKIKSCYIDDESKTQNLFIVQFDYVDAREFF
jgi:hypothetical protein